MTVVVTFISVALTRPLVALYADELGASHATVGAIVGSYAFLPMLLAVAAGSFTDRFGTKSMILFGILGMGCANLLVVVCPSLWMLVTTQAMAGLFHLCIVVACQTYASSTNTSEERQSNFGWFTTAASAGQLIGPLIGGGIADALSYRAAFAAGGLMCLPAAALSLLLRAEREKQAPPGEVLPSVQQVKELLRIDGVKAAILSSFGVLFTMGLRSSFFPLYLGEEGFPVTAVGANLSIRALTSMLVRPFLPSFIRLSGRFTVLVSSIALAALGLGLTPFMHTFFSLAVLAVCIGIGVGFCQPLSMLAVADNTGDDERGLAMGVRLTGNRLAQVTNPLMFGFVAQVTSIRSAFLLAGMLLFGTACLLLRWKYAFATGVSPSTPPQDKQVYARSGNDRPPFAH